MSEQNQTQSKSNRGGRRPGSGRKPEKLRAVLDKVKPITAELILKSINEQSLWTDMLTNDDKNIALKALIYLSDKAYGKAPQALQHTGPEGGGFRVIVEHIGRPQRPEDSASA